MTKHINRISMVVLLLLLSATVVFAKTRMYWNYANIKFYDAYREGDYNEAMSQAKLSLDEAKELDDSAIAISLGKIAMTHCARGDYAKAEPLYKESLELNENAEVLDNCAIMYCAQKRYVEAEPLFKRELTLIEKVNGPDHTNLIPALVSVALLYDSQGQHANADSLFNRALAIIEKARKEDRSAESTILKEVADSYRRAGWKNGAKELERRAASIGTSTPTKSAMAATLVEKSPDDALLPAAIQSASSPDINKDSSQDTDGDGFSDAFEYKYFGSGTGAKAIMNPKIHPPMYIRLHVRELRKTMLDVILKKVVPAGPKGDEFYIQLAIDNGAKTLFKALNDEVTLDKKPYVITKAIPKGIKSPQGILALAEEKDESIIVLNSVDGKYTIEMKVGEPVYLPYPKAIVNDDGIDKELILAENDVFQMGTDKTGITRYKVTKIDIKKEIVELTDMKTNKVYIISKTMLMSKTKSDKNINSDLKSAKSVVAHGDAVTPVAGHSVIPVNPAAKREYRADNNAGVIINKEEAEDKDINKVVNPGFEQANSPIAVYKIGGVKIKIPNPSGMVATKAPQFISQYFGDSSKAISSYVLEADYKKKKLRGMQDISEGASIQAYDMAVGEKADYFYSGMVNGYDEALKIGDCREETSILVAKGFRKTNAAEFLWAREISYMFDSSKGESYHPYRFAVSIVYICVNNRLLTLIMCRKLEGKQSLVLVSNMSEAWTTAILKANETDK